MAVILSQATLDKMTPYQLSLYNAQLKADIQKENNSQINPNNNLNNNIVGIQSLNTNSNNQPSTYTKEQVETENNFDFPSLLN